MKPLSMSVDYPIAVASPSPLKDGIKPVMGGGRGGARALPSIGASLSCLAVASALKVVGHVQAYLSRVSSTLRDSIASATPKGAALPDPVASPKAPLRVDRAARLQSGKKASSFGGHAVEIADYGDDKLEILDRTLAMDAMRYIDRVVLKGAGRKELIAELFDAVASYSPYEMIAVVERTRGGQGFDLLAYRRGLNGAIDTDLGLPDSHVPPSLLVRYADPFEVGVEELGPRLLSRLGIEGGEGLLFANLPFENDGKFAGSLALVHRRGGPACSKLRNISDQVGVAFQYISLREERERNWLAVVRSLSRAVDAKSPWTRGHSQRVADMALDIGKRLMMDTKELLDLEIAAILHDVGKIGVSEIILDKPGTLDPSELVIIRAHPVIGANIVEEVPAYGKVRDAILHHHEQWDGSGYPEGLKGEDIPLFARIIAIADVYDAISSDRPYRANMSAQDSRTFIERGVENMFDPRLARMFLEGVARNA